LGADEPHSSVISAYWEDDDTLAATIQTPDDVYTIEVNDTAFTDLLTVYHVGQKNCTVLFCNSFVRASSVKTIFGTHYCNKFSSILIFHILYIIRGGDWGTSLSFKSTAGLRTVHTAIMQLCHKTPEFDYNAKTCDLHN